MLPTPDFTRCTSIAWRASPSMSEVSLDAEPSTARPTLTPAEVGGRAVGDPDFRLGQARDLVVVDVDHVREPDVRIHPAQRFEEIDGAQLVLLEAVRLLVEGLAE